MEWKKFTKNNFENLIKLSKNKTDVLNRLKLRNNGGNYNTLTRYIENFKIDISHFKRPSYEKHNVNKMDMKIILIKNSTYSNNCSLKNRLYNEGYKERKCELCGQGEKWKDKKMSLILDHINGIHSDNRIENLRIVCPNCNATLETHGGKNLKKKYKKIKFKKPIKYCKCGKMIRKETKMCMECYSLNRRKIERPPYEQLLKDINELNYTNAGKKYGVSDNTIRKWKKKYEITILPE